MKLDMSRRAIAGIAVALGMGLPVAATAQTLPDALVKAYESNPTLRISRAQLMQADEQVAQARSDLLPDITGNGSLGAVSEFTRQGRTVGPEDTTQLQAGASIDGSLTLGSFGRTQAQIDSAVASVLAARASLVGVEQDVLLDAATAFMDVRRDIRFVDIARNNVRVINEQLRATQDRFEVGEVTRTDVSQAEAALAAARANLAASTGSLAQSRAAYLAAVGEQAGDLSPPPPIPDLPQSEAQAEAVAMREHPVLIASRYTEEAAMHDVELARAGLNPLLTLNGSVYYDHNQAAFHDNSTNEDTLGALIQLQIQVPLYRGGELDSIVRQAEAIVSQRRSETQDTARTIRQSVQLAWSGLAVARASIRANREQIAAAEVAFNGVVEEAKYGERTTLDVLDSEQTLLEARSDLVSAQRDEFVAAYNLLSAMGLLTVAHLGLTVTPYDPTANYEYVRTNPPNDDGLRLEKIVDRWN
ncbi:TolC family outer membrane protein [Oceanicella sp. SM1341]|uniref:TolC family outer membrane protein n=1 Tax=Oceanicella sp. SM1341 TaxID=1548889 RepID=UPI00130077CD|nr:TolC family outer membrane protein [Oceanicella sp. SM1341]